MVGSLIENPERLCGNRPPAETELLGNPPVSDFPEYIEIVGMICNLKPNSTHALHVHKFGEVHPNCSATFGDFNPYGQQHGSHKNDRIEDRHLGDLGNIKANNMGVARFQLRDYNLRIDDNDIFSILGRSIAVSISINKDCLLLALLLKYLLKY